MSLQQGIKIYYIIQIIMPRTQLFELELLITQEYIDDLLKDYDSDDTDADYDKDEIIKPGMTLTMNYTQTKNYSSQYNKSNFALEDATTKITVISIRTTVEDRSGVWIIGCVVKTEEPIYTSIRSAFYGRRITLHTDELTIATGGISEILDYPPKRS